MRHDLPLPPSKQAECLAAGGALRARRRHRACVAAAALGVGAPGLCGSASAQCEVQAFIQQPPSFLGAEVAIRDDLAAVGTVDEVNVYRFDGMAWALEAVLTDPDPHPNNDFGSAVAIGDVIVVGDEDHAAPELSQGVAYVFEYDGADWTLVAELIASDGDRVDYFGRTLAIHDDVIVVGAFGDDIGGHQNAGSAYIFRDDGATWREEAKLVDPEGEEYDVFGRDVAISSDVVVVGASGNDDAGSGTGAAFVYRYREGAWSLEAQLSASDAPGQAWFGVSVAVADDVAVVGAAQDDGGRGAAYVLRFDGIAWAHETKLLGAEVFGAFANFGHRVSIAPSGRAIVVGAPYDNEHGFDAGAAFVFRHDDPLGWWETARLTASDEPSGAAFGYVATSDDVAFIGAPGQLEQEGGV